VPVSPGGTVDRKDHRASLEDCSMGQLLADRQVRTLAGLYAHALAIEREAADRYREFEAYFADRNAAVLAGLCRNLATLHRARHGRYLEASSGLTLPTVEASQYRWIEGASPSAASRDFVYRTAASRNLLEIALAEENGAAHFYDEVADGSTDKTACSLAWEMADKARDNVRRIANALENIPAPGMDWEEFLAAGGGPCLALGAERRTRRSIN
jgi:rubrerythrin